jgi:uncharacterized protein DUF6459
LASQFSTSFGNGIAPTKASDSKWTHTQYTAGRQEAEWSVGAGGRGGGYRDCRGLLIKRQLLRPVGTPKDQLGMLQPPCGAAGGTCSGGDARAAGGGGRARAHVDRRGRLVVVRDLAERDLWAKRRRARAGLPSPAAVTRDIALALLEVEAGCRSATQLERVFSPELWGALEHRIGRRGGPLPSGRSLISVRCQEDAPGLADTVAVVQKAT